MANRDASTEAKEEAKDAIEAPERIFPTSQHITRARRAAGKMRPCQPDSIKELVDLVKELKAEAKG